MARHCILLSRLCIEGESKVLVRCTIALPHVMGRGAPLQESFQAGPARQIRRPRFCVRRLDSRHAETGDVLPGVCSRRGSRLTKARSYRPASASCRELCRPGSVSARRPRLPASTHQPQAASPLGGQCYPAFASIRGLRRTVSVSIHPRPAPLGVCFPPWAAPPGPWFHPCVALLCVRPRPWAASHGLCLHPQPVPPCVCPSFFTVSNADLPSINSMSKSHGDNCHRIKRPGRWHGDNCHQNKLWFTNEYGTFLRPRRCINNQLLLTIAKHRVFSPLMRHAQGRLRPVFSTASHLTVYAFRTGVAGRARLRFSPVPARVRAPPYRLTVGL